MIAIRAMAAMKMAKAICMTVRLVTHSRYRQDALARWMLPQLAKGVPPRLAAL